MRSIDSSNDEQINGLDRPAGKAASSLHDETLSRVRDYIIESDLPDGARLSERHLCDTLNITRTPLREALKVLASEGIIELLPNKGARIRSLADRDIAELFELVGGLESLAGRLACERIADEEIQEIQALHYQMYASYLDRDMHGYFLANQSIHRKIVEAAHNETLKAAYALYAGRIQRIRFAANFANNQERWGEAVREHEMILRALKRREGDELSGILVQHLRNKLAAARP